MGLSEPEIFKLRHTMNYREDDAVKESLSLCLVGKDRDDRPKICLNCFYAGFFKGNGCSYNENEEGVSIRIPVDSLGTCDNFTMSPWR